MKIIAEWFVALNNLLAFLLMVCLPVLIGLVILNSVELTYNGNIEKTEIWYLVPYINQPFPWLMHGIALVLWEIIWIWFFGWLALMAENNRYLKEISSHMKALNTTPLNADDIIKGKR